MNEFHATPSKPDSGYWGLWATTGFAALILFTIIVLSILLAPIYVAMASALDPAVSAPELFNRLPYDGCFLSVFTVIETPIVLVLIVWFIRMRRGLSVGEYLSLRPFSRRFLVWSILIILGLSIVYDGVSYALDRPILPEFMIAVYETACFRPFLYVVIILVAPVLEEVLFRGFLFEGIRHSRLGAPGAVLITSAFWAALHLQYDAFDITALFVLGIVLGVLKVRSNSLHIPILLHILVNLIATVQLIVYMNFFHNGAG